MTDRRRALRVALLAIVRVLLQQATRVLPWSPRVSAWLDRLDRLHHA